MKILLKYSALIILILAFFSCDRKMVYEKYIPINDMEWSLDSIVSFEFQIEDTAQNHNLLFNIRNSVDYSYSNLWLFVSIVPPNGKEMKDTVEFTLADPLGKWFGKGYGKHRDIQFMYRRNVFFPDSGTYKFMVKQGMREPILYGIRDIGLRVEKVE